MRALSNIFSKIYQQIFLFVFSLKRLHRIPYKAFYILIHVLLCVVI
nr:MAG TPA: hypothetical protein [Caudoviricetes sp.]